MFKPRNIFLILLASSFLETIIPLYVIGANQLRINLTLIALTILCLEMDSYRALIAGAVAGFFLDIFSAGPVGMNIISYGITGYLIGYYQRKLFKELILIKALIVFAATVIVMTLNFNIMRLFGWPQNYLMFARRWILAAVAGNTVVMFAISLIMKRLRDAGKETRTRDHR